MKHFQNLQKLSFQKLEEGDTMTETRSDKNTLSNTAKVAIGFSSLIAVVALILVCRVYFFYMAAKQPFNQFIATYDKQYGFFEFYYRAQVFYNNQKYINTHNLMDSTYELKMNKFGDMTFDEFESKYLSSLQPDQTGQSLSHSEFIETLKDMDVYSQYPVSKIADEPDTFDWRDVHAVTSIKDQGSSCGSCWAFSAIASIESVHHIVNNKTVNLSEQELVDCIGHNGCAGGLMINATDYCHEHGIRYEKDLPYKGWYQPSVCANLKPNDFPAITTVKFTVSDTADFKKKLHSTPLSVGVCANIRWMFYGSGVLTGTCKDLNHGVQAIAYGKDKHGAASFTIKNSWGDWWGEHGFIRLGDDNKYTKGPYGVYSMVSSALVAKIKDA